MITVHVDLSPLKQFASAIASQMHPGTTGPLRDAFVQWAVRYRSYTQEKFIANSKGGGAWPGLAPSTMKRRRGPRRGYKGPRIFAILIDTGILLGALDPVFHSSPGALQEEIEAGIRVGFGGSQVHPGGKATIADIAMFHNDGMGHLPKRQILWEPDAPLVEAMQEDATNAVYKMVAQMGSVS